MRHFDVFNGDADGLCAVHQLRLAQPREAIPVSGPKRAIALLRTLDAGAGDSISVFDLSFDANRDAVAALLARGASIEYFDHHFAGVVPEHPRLVAHLDPAPNVCTGIIVDRVLGGAHRPWAIVAAYGDNLAAPAARLAATLRIDGAALDDLRRLGEALAYNAYADDEADLIVSPLELLAALRPYRDPWAFLARETVWRRIDACRESDLALARGVPPRERTDRTVVVVLPAAAWARRARGALANELANDSPERACAVLSPARSVGYTVSVRAAQSRPRGADALCRSFLTGGGRAAAGGINHLAPSEVDDFVARFTAALG